MILASPASVGESFSTGKQLSIFGSNIQTQLLYFDEFSENVNIILQMSPMTTMNTKKITIQEFIPETRRVH
jgi:hypothetical protein